MKAIIYEKYGPPEVLHLQELPRPVPTDDEVLIKIYAVSVNGADHERMVGRPLYARIGGLFKPGAPILGSDIAGRVEAVGKNITQFQPGDFVFGEIPGYQGGFAEYVACSDKYLVRKPDGLSFAQAAAIPQAGVIALQGIRDKGKVQPGMQVLINGAGGSAGTFAVQLAKFYGAQVTGVDNAGKLDYIRSLGADHVIDYQGQDFTRNGIKYDLILDVIAHRSVFDYKRALTPQGNYFYVGGSVGVLFQILLLGPLIKKRSGKHIGMLFVEQGQEHLLAITDLVLSGKVIPVIDREYPLGEAREAMRYVAEGRARGKVVITVAPEAAG